MRFNEPKCVGPWSFSGREYCREPIDDIGDPEITDHVLCFGTRACKTRIVMASAAWKVVHEPFRALWVLPASKGEGGADSFSRTRLQPMFRATEETSVLIPSKANGSSRHNFKTMQMMMGGSIIGMAGSNSAAQLAGNPCDLVIQDEIDKFKLEGKREANASYLADQRAKEFSNPKRIKTSSPSTVDGLIWQELLKTDFQRRFLPCPHCGKFVVLAWQKDSTVLPLIGCEAFVKWDDEARRPDGSWDLERVEKSARYTCPFCAGHILDGHKTRMDREGEWRPTKAGAPRMRGRHLPSMYAVSVETTVGRMATRFLKAKESLEGIKGFVNSDLAEPYQGQEAAGERVELVSPTFISEGKAWTLLLTIDCQRRAPYFWYVKRAWDGGNSEGIEAGPANTFDELRQIQLKPGAVVSDTGVMVDSGFGAKSDADVYRNCAQFGDRISRPGKLDYHCGWMPSKGVAKDRRWRDLESGLFVPFHLQPIDPFNGTVDAGNMQMDLFEFASEYYEDILDNLRKQKTKYRWSVLKTMDTPEYWRHMNGHISKQKKDGSWYREKRHSSWPDHLLDCENSQIALANFSQLFSLEEDK